MKTFAESKKSFATHHVGAALQARSALRGLHPSAVQPKIRGGTQTDRLEREADAVAADHVAHGGQVGRPAAGSAAAHRPRGIGIESGSTHGEPLPSAIREEMGRGLGADFRNVRVHANEDAFDLSRSLNARAFTFGSDIFFNRGEYNPASRAGRHLLAHELTHVVQQAATSDGVQRKMIQRTRVGEVLNEFFWPWSAERLWVMDEGDRYTDIVRAWKPVTDAVAIAKSRIEADCTTWAATHRSDSSWVPGKTDPPKADKNADYIGVPSPPGTDPETCKTAFIIYVGTGTNVETWELSTCSIGSFSLFITVDSVDCAAKTAQLNIWMYNAMSRRSFGRYASHPAFAHSGMAKQYMWWNWKEPHHWGPPTPASGGSGGISRW